MIFIPMLAFCRLLRQYGRSELGGLLFRPIDEPERLQIPASQDPIEHCKEDIGLEKVKCTKRQLCCPRSDLNAGGLLIRSFFWQSCAGPSKRVHVCSLKQW